MHCTSCINKTFSGGLTELFELICLFHDNHAFMQQLRCRAILHIYTQHTPTQKWTYPLTTQSEWNENQKHLANSYINPSLAPSSHHICFCYCLRGASFCWLWNLVKSVPRCPFFFFFAIFRREKKKHAKGLKKFSPFIFFKTIDTPAVQGSGGITKGSGRWWWQQIGTLSSKRVSVSNRTQIVL